MSNHPCVIDQALRDSYRTLWDWRPVAQLLPKARRFLLNDEASHRLGEVIRDTEDLILEHHQFALPPYPVTYIEFNIDTMQRALGREVSSYDGPMDVQIGYLVSGLSVRSFVRASDGRHTIGPFILHKGDGLRGSMRLPEEIGHERWARLCIFLGSSIHALPNNELRATLLRDWALKPACKFKYTPEVCAGATGDLRNLFAILLLLNQPHIVNVTPVARRTGLSRGKRMVYAAHSIVNIELGRRKNYRKLLQKGLPRRSPRRHEVRGHFTHWGTKDGCVHQWPIMPSEAPKTGAPTWTCKLCGGKRTWREAFERGDAGVGFVTKEYDLS